MHQAIRIWRMLVAAKGMADLVSDGVHQDPGFGVGIGPCSTDSIIGCILLGIVVGIRIRGKGELNI